ncbi:ECF RNA polymerase sigma factor SigK [Streptomyces sp. BE20]|uniref:ECF RNA polymerase sigma factor SigK n=1 Tax=Streptomyces sp. BE20 TaxID=3002525 RepID=UPI002E7600A8|nr:ECF RNA polymerase sigma factor SigK [Streptomyces sp. BE20]MEE1825168.1 ECF RNA polymerase sigma factor SigK [Streptomyces sp. BE20]
MSEPLALPGPTAADRRLRELVARTAVGDHDAYRTLYRALAGQVLGMVRRVLRDPAQSEEVAQEVMLEVWRSAARYRPDRGGVLAWVMTMAHHRAVDRVRRSQAESSREEKAAAHLQERAFDEVAEQIENRLERERVRRCLGRLTELQRQSLVLAYYRGLTYPEVADLLEAPLSTVKTRMRDGLVRLRDCLGAGS